VLLFVTFSCYGSHLPGDDRGSCDHVRNGHRRFIAPSPGLEQNRRRLMRQPPFLLSTPQTRAAVRQAIVEVCQVRGWFLHALHVRTSHVHGIVEAESSPSRVLNDWKAYATRALRGAGLIACDRMVWTAGGSARRIGSPEALTHARRYVLEGQGEPMEVYSADPRLGGDS
jgi:REP element-mobilizing transposase RayT